MLLWPGTSPGDGPRFADGEVQGVITAPQINEVSGLAASRNNPDVLWVHNDSGDRAQIYAVNARGEYLGMFPLAGARAFDYEDIAVGPGPTPGVSYLYVGDVGDNFVIRGGTAVIYRVPEPVVYADRGDQSHILNAVDALRLRYPDGPHDAETLLCDPLSGDLYVITKRETYNRVYRAKAPGPGDQEVPLELMGTMAWTGSRFLGFPIYGAVGGDVSPDGREILRKRYHTASLFRRRPEEELSRALARPAQGIPVPCDAEQQGEAIGFDAHGQGYFTLGEGSRPSLIYHRRLSDDGPAEPALLVETGASSGPPAQRPTRSFRKQFHLDDVAAVERLTLKLHCGDGGAAVYLGGRQIARVRLKPDAGRQDAAGECPAELCDTWLTLPIEDRIVAEALVSGVNTLVVEVHDPPGRLTHVPFGLQLLATPARSESRPATPALLGALGAVAAFFVLYGLWRWRRSRRFGAG
jgi:hypothetical protein